jgi:hypothetical protein
MTDTCTATSKAGTPCRARPMAGALTCFLHGPDAEAARARGGRARGKDSKGAQPAAAATGALSLDQHVPMGTHQQIRAAMELAFNAMRTGTLNARAGTAMVGAARLALAAVTEDVSEQLARLKAMVEAQQPRTAGRRR